MFIGAGKLSLRVLQVEVGSAGRYTEDHAHFPRGLSFFCPSERIEFSMRQHGQRFADFRHDEISGPHLQARRKNFSQQLLNAYFTTTLFV